MNAIMSLSGIILINYISFMSNQFVTNIFLQIFIQGRILKDFMPNM